MKMHRFASAVIMATLALWVSYAQAQAIPFPKLNFNLIAAQQELDVSETSSNVFVSTIKTFRITNKDLLDFLATALHTNWPAGAHLVRVATDIVVADKAGTNIVYDVSTGINDGDTNVVFFSMDIDRTVVRSDVEAKGELVAVTNEFGPGVGFRGDSGSISVQGSNFGKIFFRLFYEQDGVTNTDLYFEGLNTGEFHSNRVLTTNKITGYAIAIQQAPVTGDGTLNNTWTVIKGKVSSSVKERGGIPEPARPPILPFPFPPITNPPPIIIFHPITNFPPPIIFPPTTNLPPPIRLEP